MSLNQFRIVPGTDKEYVDAFDAIKADSVFVYDKITLDYLGHVGPEGVSTNQGIVEVLAESERVVPNFVFHFPDNWHVNIQRQPDQNAPFDVVTVNRPNQQQDPLRFAKLMAAIQKHLHKTTSLMGVADLLGPSAKEHFQAREIALARLEKMGSDMLLEMEQARKRREQEFGEKEKGLKETNRQRERELDAAIAKQKQELDARSTELDALRKELDDRAAKHARRQHYKDIKEKFKSWSETFQVTPGTNLLRRSVYWFTCVLLVLFGGVAGWFLFQSVVAQDNVHLVSALVKQITFTALFVSTAYFFIRWNNQWFRRHANEEFRLKRMELDIDRASWFVEMAFEWKDEKGEEIPEALIDRLTQGLFSEPGSDHAVEPAESLAHALMGAARFKVKLPGDIEVEYDRKGVEKILRDEKRRQKGDKQKP
jgi:hypothetical protein